VFSSRTFVGASIQSLELLVQVASADHMRAEYAREVKQGLVHIHVYAAGHDAVLSQCVCCWLC
jgi:hypothetical protein